MIDNKNLKLNQTRTYRIFVNVIQSHGQAKESTV